MTNDRNTGDSNTGDSNTGDSNTGDSNTGNWNTGNRNTGYSNTGNRNTGDSNTGNWNTGYSNTGNRNTGNRNTGYWNTGNRNTGYWNKADFCTGNFNTITPTSILVFNKPCSRETWSNAIKPDFIFFNINIWIPEADMTEQEKTDNEFFYVVEGYLKSITPEEAWKSAWEGATHEDKELLFKLPNFDAEVFKEISGIDVSDGNVESEEELTTMVINGKKYKLTEIND